MSEAQNSGKSRKFCREAEILAVENALELLRADDMTAATKKHHHAWESLAQRALRRSRALTLVALCEAMLDANMSEEQVAAILLAAKI